ncbi:hypothetical protein EDB19DRAFT_336467 [Suillus lakei]|nr:hypothetical protein EDB19DRAFT_336467 [Suillus lakei]
MLVTKHAARRVITLPPATLRFQPEKSRPHKLKQQKRQPRATRMNAAYDSIARSHLRRHANRIVGHLAQVCEQIRTDQSGLMDGWVSAMAEVGLTSMLAGNHRTSPGSLFAPRADTLLVLAPGSRMKARLTSLRHRTNAVAAAIPATTTFPPLELPQRRTSSPPTFYVHPHGLVTNCNANNHRLLTTIHCDSPPMSRTTYRREE